jgi:hypothetical protein
MIMLQKPMWWRVMAYTAVFLPFLFLVGSLWIVPDATWQEIPDWRSVLTHAEAALDKGDLYETRALYSRVGRLASWRGDWQGLLAAACGMKKTDRESPPYPATYRLLIRAVMAAELKQSRAGIAEAARAFAALGEHKAAEMTWARLRPNWAAETDASSDADARDCWPAD